MPDDPEWFVYVLVSECAERTYVGIALNPDKRLEEHNGIRAGGARSTRAHRPWKLATTYGPYANRSEACTAEARVKKLKGLARLRWQFATWLLLCMLAWSPLNAAEVSSPSAFCPAAGFSAQESNRQRGSSQYFQWRAPDGHAELATRMAAEADRALEEAHRWLGLAKIGSLGEQPRPGKMIWVKNREGINRHLKREMPTWVSAVAIPARGEIVISVQSSAEEYRLRSTLRHELLHHAIGALGVEAFQRLPAWFHEGMAEEFSGEVYLAESGISLSWMAMSGNLRYLSEYENDFGRQGLRAAEGYAQGHAFVAMLRQDFGPEVVPQILLGVYQGMNFEKAVLEATGFPLVELEERMRTQLTSFRRLAQDFYQHFITLLFALACLLLPFIWLRRRRRRERMEERWERQEEDAKLAEHSQAYLIDVAERDD